MAVDRVFGTIEYGFREALQKLSDSMKDASAVVGKWKELCTSSQPTVTLSMSDGDYEVMTLSGIKASVSDWVNKTTGLLVRTRLRAAVNDARYAELGEAAATFTERGLSQYKKRVSYYRHLGTFADVTDVYRLSSVEDTDSFGSMFELPRILEVNGATAFTTSGSSSVHKVAIRSTPAMGNLPYTRTEAPVASMATEFLLLNATSATRVIEFYSGSDYSQKVASITLPGVNEALPLICMGDVGAAVRIYRIV